MLDVDGISVTASTTINLSVGDRVHIAIRPERIDLMRDKPASLNFVFESIVESALYHGTISTYRVRLQDSGHATLVIRQINRERIVAADALEPGTRVWVSWAPGSVNVMKN